MGTFKKIMGLDFVDVTIHVVTTGFLAGLGSTLAHPNDEPIVFFVLAASTIALGVRRHVALRRQSKFPEITGEAAAARIEELESRVADLEVGQHRVLELEERLDFTERMLAQQRDVVRLAPPVQ